MSVIRRPGGSSSSPTNRAPRTQAGTRIRRFVFTVNNPTLEEYRWLTEDYAPTVKWIIIAREKGSETNTPHLQAACLLNNQVSFTALKKLPGFKRAHIEVMYGTPQDSLVYCSKEDPEPFVMGTLPSPGKRNDIHAATERVLAGVSLRELAMDDEIGAVAVVKYHKGLTVLRSLTRPDRTEPPKVVWLYGKTGTGKTRSVYDVALEYTGGNSDDIWISGGDLQWFDGYDGQRVAVFDDFRAKHVKSFAFFLRLLDRYPLRVPVKGTFVNWTPEVIFVTCPYCPDECFATRKEHVPEDIEQLSRRISKVYELRGTMGSDERRTLVSQIVALVSGRPGGSDGDVRPGEEGEESMEETQVVGDFMSDEDLEESMEEVYTPPTEIIDLTLD